MIRTKKWGSPFHMSFYSTRNLSKISLRRSSDPFCFVNINFYDDFDIQEYILLYFYLVFLISLTSVRLSAWHHLHWFYYFHFCLFFLWLVVVVWTSLFISQQNHVLGETILVPRMRKNVFLPKQVEATHACSQWGKAIQLWRLRKGF